MQNNADQSSYRLPTKSRPLTRLSCERARRARDARFDGRFFTAVKTTGIYCRPICPANPPLEKNVEYYPSAITAAQAGFRPCLRCRPDSAPDSWAWLGAQTTFLRAVELIHQGELQSGSIASLASRLGISDRYLRELFQQNIGTSPKKYGIYRQCLFAKQLLHESSLPVTQIAFAAGFKSVRRFNEAMQLEIGLSPREIRKSDKPVDAGLSLKLYFRPPFAWQQLHQFLSRREIPGLEWTDQDSYARTIRFASSKGFFRVSPKLETNHLSLELHLDDYRHLHPITQKVKSMFDVDAPINDIDRHLKRQFGKSLRYQRGLRVPGIWSIFEAGVRAILGQQVSVAAAGKLVEEIVFNLGEVIELEGLDGKLLFPEPESVADASLAFLRMPQSRKDTLRRLAEHMLITEDPANIDRWLDIKGIGPWTIAYVKMRAAKDPDIWLAGDAGLNNALSTLPSTLDQQSAKPWRSYLTMQLWNQL